MTMATLSPEDIAYLRQQASTQGYNPDDMLRAINYESSGDPTRWGGKGGNYFGLIQFGPNERKQFGVDTANPNARNQIDAAFKFLQTRGFKPGMGLLDLYSTINAGSPGHYNASDGNGTVQSHVAAMMGKKMFAPGQETSPTIPGATPPVPGVLAYAPTSEPKKDDPIAALLSQPQTSQPDAIGKLIAQMEPQQAPIDNSANEALLKQMQDFHNMQHMRAVQGLLN